jgi:hypothetical protein
MEEILKFTPAHNDFDDEDNPCLSEIRLVPFRSIKKNPIFETLLPPLGGRERRELELSLATEGIREPLLVWERNNDGTYILIDGYNRYRWLASKNVSEVEVRVRRFPKGEDEAICWALGNQLGRRNLTPQLKMMYIAELYRLRRATSPETKAAQVRAVIAEEVGVKEAVVVRAVKIANELGKLPKRVSQEFIAGRLNANTLHKISKARRVADNRIDDGYDAVRKYLNVLKVLLNVGWEARVHLGTDEWGRLSRIIEQEMARVRERFYGVAGIEDLLDGSADTINTVYRKKILSSHKPGSSKHRNR